MEINVESIDIVMAELKKSAPALPVVKEWKRRSSGLFAAEAAHLTYPHLPAKVHH